jgi:hypothetical protein
VSDDGYSWNTSLPSMPRARAFPVVVNTGTPEYLLVAGGYSHNQVAVEVLMEGQWWILPSVPCKSLQNCCSIKCCPYAIIHSGKLCFLNAYCDLQALLASRRKPNSALRSTPNNLWSELISRGGVFSFQGQLLYFLNDELRLSFDDSLVTIGGAVDSCNEYLIHRGKMVFVSNINGFCVIYTASIQGTVKVSDM